MAASAQRWADTQAKEQKTSYAKGLSHSESVYSGRHSDALETALRLWLCQEAKIYNSLGISSNNLQNSRHYAAAIWPGTRWVGMGWARDTTGKDYVVARYAPAEKTDMKP